MGKGMRAGKKPKTRQSGGDMQKQLKQLQRMQAEMEETQAQLGEKEITTTAGGGAVEVTVTGKKEVVKVVFDKDAVDPDDVEMLQDLVMAATNEALRMADAASQEAMGRMTGGLGLGGGYPF